MMGPDKRLIYMGNGRQSHAKTSAAEQRVPTNWRQHSPIVDVMMCNKINNITITIEATINVMYDSSSRSCLLPSTCIVWRSVLATDVLVSLVRLYGAVYRRIATNSFSGCWKHFSLGLVDHSALRRIATNCLLASKKYPLTYFPIYMIESFT